METFLGRLSFLSIEGLVEYSVGPIEVRVDGTSGSERGEMGRKAEASRQEMLLGTLDMLILRTLVMGAAHGHTIAHAIERSSDEVLQVEQGRSEERRVGKEGRS